jgi:hypothetical protein
LLKIDFGAVIEADAMLIFEAVAIKVIHRLHVTLQIFEIWMFDELELSAVLRND